MELFPAIDLQNGCCVRLKQGDFDASTTYSDDPMQMLRSFAVAGASWAHLVDLDGARAGTMKQVDLIAELARNAPIKVQVGGGVRTEAQIEKLLKAGVARVVIGSLAVREPDKVMMWLHAFGPEHIVLAFDIRIDEDGAPEVLTNGWTHGSHRSLWDVMDLYATSGLQYVLCTDVSRDGMLMGTNHDLYRVMSAKMPRIKILASGGVKDEADIRSLSSLGLYGAIVGKALYEGRVDLARAVRQEKA